MRQYHFYYPTVALSILEVAGASPVGRFVPTTDHEEITLRAMQGFGLVVQHGAPDGDSTWSLTAAGRAAVLGIEIARQARDFSPSDISPLPKVQA